MEAYKIENFLSRKDDRPFITKFGGQPDWLEEPAWPVSYAWDNRPLKFIGQVRLNDFYPELEELTLAYIFLTQPENREDPFFDPDIIFPDEGENAILIQPNGKIPEYVNTEEFRTGPTVDAKTVWIPRMTRIRESETMDFKQIDEDKFCGIPALFQENEVERDCSLLLQLHTNWLPFYVNAGGAPTLFTFLNDKKDEGFILIEDM